MQSISAFIFDMDGVLSDTQQLHSRIESEVLAEYGIIISPEEISPRFAGTRTEEIFAKILEEHHSSYSVADLLEEKWRRVTAMAESDVVPIKGAIALLERLTKEGYPLSVASSSRTAYVELILRSLGIENHFQYVVTGEMVKRGKPDPDIFLLAAEKMHFPPEECIVIEDSRLGMLAARDAGMRCIGLVEDIHREYPTPHLVQTLDEVTPEYIASL